MAVRGGDAACPTASGRHWRWRGWLEERNRGCKSPVVKRELRRGIGAVNGPQRTAQEGHYWLQFLRISGDH